MQENAGGASGTEKQRKKKANENVRPMPPPSNYATKQQVLLTKEVHVNESFENSARSK